MLLDHETIARKRLDNLSKGLSADRSLQPKYDDVFVEYESSGFIEQVTDEICEPTQAVYYMPHHPVVKEDRVTTKVKPVFDASSRG